MFKKIKSSDLNVGDIVFVFKNWFYTPYITNFTKVLIWARLGPSGESEAVQKKTHLFYTSLLVAYLGIVWKTFQANLVRPENGVIDI